MSVTPVFEYLDTYSICYQNVAHRVPLAAYSTSNLAATFHVCRLQMGNRRHTSCNERAMDELAQEESVLENEGGICQFQQLTTIGDGCVQ